jgi:hypothetical protein
MTSSIVFLNENPLFFFLDSNSPFNCLNASINILLPYMQVYEEIPPVLVLSTSFIPAPNQN